MVQLAMHRLFTRVHCMHAHAANCERAFGRSGVPIMIREMHTKSIVTDQAL